MSDFFLYGEITTNTAAEFAAFFNENKDVTLHLNSCGGDIFAAVAIANLIKNKNVQIQVDGLAASAATLICSGGNVTAAANSLFMLHEPLTLLIDYYNSSELEKVQTALNAVKDVALLTYSNKLKMTADEITAAMKNETWLSAEQAKQIGLVDEISADLIEMKMSADRKFVMVGKLQVPAANFPQNLIPTPEKTLLNEKYKQSILTADRSRIAALLALRSDNPKVNSIIDDAIKTDLTAEDIAPRIIAIKPNPAENYLKMLQDNLNSGAENVGGSIPTDKDNERENFINNVAKYTNELLGVKARG